MKIYMFRTVRLSIIRSLFTVHSVVVYVIQVCRQPSSSTRMKLHVPSWSCSKAVYKPAWHIPLLSVQWIYSWWWTEELSETCRVSCQNKFVKLVHLIGFIIKKFGPSHNKDWEVFLHTYRASWYYQSFTFIHQLIHKWIVEAVLMSILMYI